MQLPAERWSADPVILDDGNVLKLRLSLDDLSHLRDRPTKVNAPVTAFGAMRANRYEQVGAFPEFMGTLDEHRMDGLLGFIRAGLALACYFSRCGAGQGRAHRTAIWSKPVGADFEPMPCCSTHLSHAQVLKPNENLAIPGVLQPKFTNQTMEATLAMEPRHDQGWSMPHSHHVRLGGERPPQLSSAIQGTSPQCTRPLSWLAFERFPESPTQAV
eukprot:1159319-Pelagomonas_calceolata.AAC.1